MASSIFPGLQLQLKISDFFGTSLPRSNYVHLKQNSNVKPLVVEARANSQAESAKIRNRRLRKKFNGTAAKPRLSVFCSDKHLYAMLVDDQQKKCLFYASTLQQSIRKDPSCSTIFIISVLDRKFFYSLMQNLGKHKSLQLQEAAKRVGEELVKACTDLDVNEISSYDRNGFARGEKMQAFEIAISRHGFLSR